MSENKSKQNKGLQLKVFESRSEKVPQPFSVEKKILPSLPAGILITGRSSSGKTNLVQNILTQEKLLGNYFDFIYLFTGIHPDENVIKNINIPEEQVFLDFSLEDVEKIFDKMEKTIKSIGIGKAPKILMVFDDILQKSEFLKSNILRKIATASRHFNISWIILSQYYKLIPSVVRQNANALILFPSSESEVIKFAEEQCVPNLSKKQYIELIKFATNKQYDFFYQNNKCDKNMSCRKNFDTILNYS